MVDVKMGQRDVRDRLPRFRQLGETARRSRTAVDQQLELIRLDQYAAQLRFGDSATVPVPKVVKRTLRSSEQQFDRGTNSVAFEHRDVHTRGYYSTGVVGPIP